MCRTWLLRMLRRLSSEGRMVCERRSPSSNLNSSRNEQTWRLRRSTLLKVLVIGPFGMQVMWETLRLYSVLGQKDPRGDQLDVGRQWRRVCLIQSLGEAGAVLCRAANAWKIFP